jgi:hypothetical protein
MPLQQCWIKTRRRDHLETFGLSGDACPDGYGSLLLERTFLSRPSKIRGLSRSLRITQGAGTKMRGTAPFTRHELHGKTVTTHMLPINK